MIYNHYNQSGLFENKIFSFILEVQHTKHNQLTEKISSIFGNNTFAKMTEL